MYHFFSGKIEPMEFYKGMLNHKVCKNLRVWYESLNKNDEINLILFLSFDSTSSKVSLNYLNP